MQLQKWTIINDNLSHRKLEKIIWERKIVEKYTPDGKTCNLKIIEKVFTLMNELNKPAKAYNSNKEA